MYSNWIHHSQGRTPPKEEVGGLKRSSTALRSPVRLLHRVDRRSLTLLLRFQRAAYRATLDPAAIDIKRIDCRWAINNFKFLLALHMVWRYLNINTSAGEESTPKKAAGDEWFPHLANPIFSQRFSLSVKIGEIFSGKIDRHRCLAVLLRLLGRRTRPQQTWRSKTHNNSSVGRNAQHKHAVAVREQCCLLLRPSDSQKAPFISFHFLADLLILLVFFSISTATASSCLYRLFRNIYNFKRISKH